MEGQVEVGVLGISRRRSSEFAEPRQWGIARTRAPPPYDSLVRKLDSVSRAVLAFALLGLAVLALVGVTGTLVLRRLATEQAISQARDFTAFSARVVERRVRDELLTGDAEASAAG